MTSIEPSFFIFRIIYLLSSQVPSLWQIGLSYTIFKFIVFEESRVSVMKTTIYQVAEKAGVSISTVSKVINNTGRISEETRKKVKRIMKELNFQPSVVASALTGKQTKTIGFLISDISNPFYAEVARKVENRSRELGFHVMMCSTDNEEEKEKNYLSLLTRQRVDGLIIASEFHNTDILAEVIENQQLPVVLIASDIPKLPIHSVRVDDYQGSYLATSHLVQLGHQRIAMIAEKIRSNHQRVVGYKDVLGEYDLPLYDEYVIYTEATHQRGYEAAMKLLSLENRPTAIFASNDLLATGIIKAAKNSDIEVPNKLSVVGFDNTILSTVITPALTTIAQPVQEMASKVVDLLMEEMEQPSKYKQRLLFTPELIIRDSTL